jgi:hypothetical protein
MPELTQFSSRTPSTSPTGKPTIVPTGLLSSKSRLILPLQSCLYHDYLYFMLYKLIDSHKNLFLYLLIRSILQLARVGEG